MGQGRWIVDAAAVAAEKFDDETVVLHFESGRYYSLGGAACWIWQALEQPTDARSIVTAVPGGASASIAADIEAFLAELREQKLIVAIESPAVVPPVGPVDWTVPSIEVFSDLSDLIALDPVHEVDAMLGWPRRPNQDVG